MSDFKYDNGKIYSLITGDLVACVESNGLKMQPGKNALTPKVKAFFESLTEEEKQCADHNELPGVDNTPAAEEDFEEEEVNTHILEDKQPYGETPAAGSASAPARELKEVSPKSAKALAVWDIPESSLPEFSPALGVATPGFKAFVKKHKFSAEQVAELVKRLEKLKFKAGSF